MASALILECAASSLYDTSLGSCFVKVINLYLDFKKEFKKNIVHKEIFFLDSLIRQKIRLILKS